jgi:hypothetical protein
MAAVGKVMKSHLGLTERLMSCPVPAGAGQSASRLISSGMPFPHMAPARARPTLSLVSIIRGCRLAAAQHGGAPHVHEQGDSTRARQPKRRGGPCACRPGGSGADAPRSLCPGCRPLFDVVPLLTSHQRSTPMPPRRPRMTTGHPWGRTGDADGDTSTDRRGASQTHAAWIAPGASRRSFDAPHPWRELLKPILDELNDKLESFEGEPTPEDHRWLWGQLRKLVDRLDLP